MWDECEWIQIHLLWLRAQMCDGKCEGNGEYCAKTIHARWMSRLWGLQVPCFAVGGQLTVHKMSLTISSLIVEMGAAVVDARLCQREKDDIMEKTRQILITEMEIFSTLEKKNVDNVERVSLGYVRVLSSFMMDTFGRKYFQHDERHSWDSHSLSATWCVTTGNRMCEAVREVKFKSKVIKIYHEIHEISDKWRIKCNRLCNLINFSSCSLIAFALQFAGPVNFTRIHGNINLILLKAPILCSAITLCFPCWTRTRVLGLIRRIVNTFALHSPEHSTDDDDEGTMPCGVCDTKEQKH